MNTDYNSFLQKVPFYERHKEYLPFIGDKYDTYKILLVGESHYIGQKSQDEPEFTLSYFTDHWWDGTQSELDAKYKGWYTTRAVVENYLEGNRTRGHLIFTNTAKTFSEKILDQPIAKIDKEKSQVFHYFAFMNFFQMPSLYEGMKFWDALRKFGENNKNHPVWDKCVSESSEVLDKVIDILHPQLVVFVSTSAYDAFKNSKANHANDKIIKSVPHPNCPWWHRKIKSKDNKSGKEMFADILNDILDK